MAAVVLESEKLAVTVADNAPDTGRYGGSHGVASLIHRESGRELFLPAWSGLSLESISFSGLPPADDVVGAREPRHCPMTLDSSVAGEARLRQPATRHFGVETEIAYRLLNAETVEMEACYRFHNPLTESRTFVALWVSRMNGPENRRLYFPGHTAGNTTPRWLRLAAASHDAPRRVADADAAGPETDDRFVWGAPFWYGAIGGLAWIAIFSAPAVTGLAYSPTAGFAEPSPACGWNFFHRITPVRRGLTYKVRQQFVCKPFAGRDGVVAEFRRVSGQALDVELR